MAIKMMDVPPTPFETLVRAREIALAFGVPPMILGLPGDNTYSNFQEANRAFLVNQNRCIVPADGFYEWEPKDRGKLPHYFYATDQRPLALAGLWASWEDPESGDRVRTCTIVTGKPSDVVSPIHDRMPVILPKSAWGPWLDPDNRDSDGIRELAASLPVPDLSEHAVSTLVNRVANDIPDLIKPLESGAV